MRKYAVSGWQQGTRKGRPGLVCTLHGWLHKTKSNNLAKTENQSSSQANNSFRGSFRHIVNRTAGDANHVSVRKLRTNVRLVQQGRAIVIHPRKDKVHKHANAQ